MDGERIAQAYKAAFLGPNGQIVLADLVSEYVLTPGMNPAKRDLVLAILNLVYSKQDDAVDYLLALKEGKHE